MREHKFRVWDKEEKKIIYLQNGNTHHTFYFTNNGAYYYNLQNGSGFDEYIIMQYIGIKDKNEKEIYEGDIVKTNSKLKRNFEIKFLDGAFCMGFMESGNYRFCNYVTIRDAMEQAFNENIELEIEVIGNIYENPELLQGARDET